MDDPERSNNNNDPAEIEIDLRQFINVITKWRKLIITGTVICALSVGLLSFFVIPPTYEAETLLMVTQATDKLQTNPQANQKNDGLDNVVSTMSQMPVLTMTTYLGQIKSEAVMQRVIDKLELDPKVYTPATLADKIDASIVKDSNLLDIKITNGDPVLAAKIANAFSAEYLQLMTEKNKEQMTRSMTFLDGQQTIADAKLKTAIAALEVSQSQPQGVPVLEAQLKNKNSDLVDFSSRLQMDQVEISQLSASISSLEKEVASIPQMISVKKWDEINNKEIDTQEINPLYTSVSDNLSQDKASLAGKQAESEQLQVMVDSLSSEIDALQGELVTKKADQDTLQREVDRLTQTSETLAQKGTETQIAKSIDMGDTSVMVISEATVPSKPVKPNKTLNVAIAMVVGLLLFTLSAFILNYLDNTLKRPEDITRELGVPVLGVIPLATQQNTLKNRRY